MMASLYPCNSFKIHPFSWQYSVHVGDLGEMDEEGARLIPHRTLSKYFNIHIQHLFHVAILTQ